MTARQSDLRGPLAIVVGSEGQGLGPAVRRRADLFMRIPMKGAVGSLNAAVAGSILLFEALAQRDPNATPRVTSALGGGGEEGPPTKARARKVAKGSPTRRQRQPLTRPPKRPPTPTKPPRPRRSRSRESARASRPSPTTSPRREPPTASRPRPRPRPARRSRNQSHGCARPPRSSPRKPRHQHLTTPCIRHDQGQAGSPDPQTQDDQGRRPPAKSWDGITGGRSPPDRRTQEAASASAQALTPHA